MIGNTRLPNSASECALERWWRSRRLALSALLFPLFIVTTSPGWAWGTAGHAIIADIAESRLSPQALAQVLQLLALHHQRHLSDVASWADEWRFNHPETGPWHFVNIPLLASNYDSVRDCPNGNCVVAKIDEFTKVLADRERSPEDRLQALEFVVHFVGHVHQPLHVSNNDDEGGNLIPVTYLGQSVSDRGYPWTLHSVWDTAIIGHHLLIDYGADAPADDQRSEVISLAHQLEGQITHTMAENWTYDGLNPIGWAIESHDVARMVAYRGILDSKGKPLPQPINVGSGYDSMAWAAIRLQLERAGVRLAAVLNEILK